MLGAIDATKTLRRRTPGAAALTQKIISGIVACVGIALAEIHCRGGKDDGTRHDGSVGSDALGHVCADGSVRRVAVRVSFSRLEGDCWLEKMEGLAMFTFPAMSFLTAPVLMGDLRIDFPMIGAVVAWTLIVALVGTLLGVLREHTSPHPKVRQRVAVAGAHVDADDIHPEAA